jgi:hypothetical protein
MVGKTDIPDTKIAESGAEPPRRGGFGLKAIAIPTRRIVAKTVGRHGFADASLIADWESVVGPLIGQSTLPLRITFPGKWRSGGTLVVRVASGGIATELQHLEPRVVERINSHFGYGAVAKLALVQGPVPRRAPPKPPPTPPPPEAERALEAKLAEVDDPGLKDVLMGLGRQLAAGKPST